MSRYDPKNPFVGFTKPLFLLPKKKKHWLELVEIGGRLQFISIPFNGDSKTHFAFGWGVKVVHFHCSTTNFDIIYNYVKWKSATKCEV
jgi:hypothetical protein